MKKTNADIISVAKPFYTMLRCFGFAPCCLPSPGGGGARNPAIELRYTVASCLACSFTLLSVHFCIHLLRVSEFEFSKDHVIVTVQTVLNTGITLSYFVMLVNAYVHREKSTKMLIALERIDELLPNVRSGYAKSSRFLWTCITLTVLFILTMFTLDFVRLLARLDLSQRLIGSWITFAYMLFYVGMLFEMLVPIVWAMVVVARLSEVNYELGQTGSFECRKKCKLSRRAVVATRENSVPRIKPTRFTKLMQVHFKITEIIAALNERHGIPTIFSVLFNFGGILLCAFFMIRQVLQGDDLAAYFVVTRSIWVVYFVASLWLLASTANDCGRLIDETTVLLHEMQVNQLDDLGAQCDKFLHQLANTDMKLTAYGFFQIDRRLLGGIAGAATTYLVVLLQIK